MSDIGTIVEERHTVRCSNCGLNQFVTKDNTCRRCHAPDLERKVEEKVEEVESEIPVPREVHIRLTNLEEAVGRSLKVLRIERHISQRQLASMSNFQRTYISKVEKGHTTPSLVSLDRLADGLGISLVDFISRVSRIRSRMGDGE